MSVGPSLELDANVVLAAGAGAGKTHALVTVALGLYVGAGASGRAPIEPGCVWAVTFTEKAARELRQRIVERARALAESSGGALADEAELAAMLGERSVSPATWRGIVDGLASAPIGTFHSLCAQILRAHAVEAGVDPEFDVLDENEAAELFARVLDEVLLRELESGDDSHTRAAANALGGPEALRAALLRLHRKLGEEGRDPESLLVDAHKRAQPGFDAGLARAQLVDACFELRAAIELLESSTEDRLRPTTRTLALERGRIGACEPEAIERWYPAVARVAGQRRGKGTLPKRARRVWEPFALAWEAVQDAQASLVEIALASRVVALSGAVADAYAAEKHRRGALDFVDLVRGAHDLLRDDRAVRRELQRGVGALLVDEFQDTNGLQLDLVHLLAEARDRVREVPKGARASEVLPLGERLLAAVGDRKQSIYEFRGADVSLFQRLAGRARAGEDGLRLAALRRSWRSRPGLVEFANQLFARLLVSDDEAGFAVDWIDGVDDLEPVREDHSTQAGLPAVQLLRGDPTLDARVRRGREADRLAEHVELLLRAAPPFGRGRADEPAALRGADVAILMRTHGHVARYRRALRDRGIASVVVGGRGFYAAREIRALAALTLALADPGDALASAAVWRSPIWGISDSSLVALAVADRVALRHHADGCALGGLPEPDAASVARMGRLVSRLHHELDRLGPARVLRALVDELGVREVLAWDDAGEQRIANVDKLLALLDTSAFAGVGARAVARRLLERGEDRLDREAPAEVAATADPDAVRILTIHAAKGLEFPVVVVPELGAEPRGQEGPVVFERELGLAVSTTDMLGRRRISAHARAVGERLAARRDAESRRLLYVAATRARDLLVLLGEAPEGRAGEGNWRRLIEGALPELGDLVEVVDAGPVYDADSEVVADGEVAAMRWLLDRVAAVRRQAVEADAVRRRAVEGDAVRQRAVEGDSSWLDPAAVAPGVESARTPAPDTDAALESREALAAALARSEPLELRGCELTISLSGFAEFDGCPRRYLLSHVVGVDVPPEQSRTPTRGLQLLPFAPRRREVGDERPPTLAEARARGRAVHHMLARVDLDRLGRDPEGAFAAFARSDRVPDELLDELRADLLRVASRPWMRAVIAAYRSDPRRVLRSLPFALHVEAAPAPVDGPVHAPQLDLFARPDLHDRSAAAPRGSVVVRGRVDLVWIDDAGRGNVVDWQYAHGGGRPPLDPTSAAGFRRLAQACALRRMWGASMDLRLGAAFLRDDEPDPALHPVDPEVLADFERRMGRTAGRLLYAELATVATTAWPRLARRESCGACVHVERCWEAEHRAERPGVDLGADLDAEADADASVVEAGPDWGSPPPDALEASPFASDDDEHPFALGDADDHPFALGDADSEFDSLA